ncbi:hypothetical protein F1B92_08035 [Campylobacter sp. FMV-PI01]|uniref:Campylobacter invasion antigen D C-terminal domain-containing protein n=1 Tax=Campylobacter portucalensis TaxID=2608384 RepID=A0A6L5WLE0_9BACT|nr:hypothetical protein [Campylobacter portucalensis]MSN97107.1 hypothetical protein [Campylobacter portucalensis]
MKIEELTQIVIKELEENSKNQIDDEYKLQKESISDKESSDLLNLDFLSDEIARLNDEILISKNAQKDFLINLKDRILVLFEGLNSFDKSDIEARVELSLKFMEFLLASIEKKLKNLSK